MYFKQHVLLICPCLILDEYGSVNHVRARVKKTNRHLMFNGENVVVGLNVWL